MYLLSPISKLGSIHIQTCKVFEDLTSLQSFLQSVNRKYDTFSICPEVYELDPELGISKMSDDWHSENIYPHTYNTRLRNGGFNECASSNT